MRICAHTICKNEERYIWYAVRSVIDSVDHIMIWDTGSTDNTINIIKIFQKTYPDKVRAEFFKSVDAQTFTDYRQKMLEETTDDWIIIVDADEVWWDDKIKNTTSLIRRDGKKLETVVNRYSNLVGDIFHYQEEKAGGYEIDGVRGHLSIRAMNKNIPGIHIEKPHGLQGYFDKNGTLIQERDKDKRVFIDGLSYLHFTHLLRSTNFKKDQSVVKRKLKYKYEIGEEFAKDFYYPEAFFKPRPEIVKSPWLKMSLGYKARSFPQTLFKKVKRRVITPESGY